MESVGSAENSGSRVGLAYLIGSYSTEVLVAVYGQQKMIDFYRSFDANTSIPGNFEKVFGISLETFYAKLTPYIAAVSQELTS